MTDRGPEASRDDAREDPIARRRRLRGDDSPEEDSARRSSAAAVFAAIQPALPPADALSDPSGASAPSGPPPATGVRTREDALAEARRVQAEEAAREKRERAERWRRERADVERAAAEQAAERKLARQAERDAAKAERVAARADRAEARREARHRRSPSAPPTRKVRPAPQVREAGPEPTVTAAPVDRPAVRTTPSAEELAALAAAPVPAAGPTSPGPAAAAGDSAAHSYRGRYAPEPPPVVDRTRQELRPRSAARAVLSVLLVVLLAAAALLGWVFWQAPTSATLGLAASCTGLLFVVWAVRASTVPVRVALEGGVLEVRDRHGRHRVDLSTTHAPVEMVGEPGEPGWSISFGRGAEPPLVLTARSVHPRRFTALVRQWRPEL